jgi:type VI protein secretion system component VasF
VSLHQEVQGCIRESSGSPSEWKYFRTSKEGVMNVLPVALVIFAVVFLAGVLWFGLATLLQIRARRQRLQMKRHLQSIERVGY